MENTSPVIVVGAGPVGLSVAIGLVRHGIKVVVLEKERELCPESRAPGVLVRTLEIFRRWGLLERVLAEGHFLTHPRVWRATDDALLIEFDLEKALDSITAVPGILILPQDQTVRILADVVSANPLAELKLGHRVESISQSEEGIEVRVIPVDGSPSYQLKGAYAVGCDGAHSVVRESLGWQLEGKTYDSVLLLADVRIADARNDRPWPRVMMMKNGAVLGALKLGPETWRLVAVLAPGEVQERAASPAGIAERVEAVLRPGPFEPLWHSLFRIHCRTSPGFRAGRILLAGDAAHINSPAGGQGMNSGIQDAHNLVWKLARAIQGGNAERLLRSYEVERREVVMTGIDRYTDFLTRYVLQGRPWARLIVFRSLTVAMRIPLLARRIAARAGMLDTRYRDSPCLLGHGDPVGRRAPDGWLTRSDGTRLRLHDLVDPDAALIIFSDTGQSVLSEDEMTILEREAAPFRVWHIVRGAAKNERELVDLDGKLWRAWSAREGRVALLRPDGHVGWVADRPSWSDTLQAIHEVLGVISNGN